MDKMVEKQVFNGFFEGRKVLITGHTGFKGSWLSIILKHLGAEVYGYSLDAPTEPSLYDLAGIDKEIYSTIGDIRDYDLLESTIKKYKPEIIIHMAAQALVRESYINPRETYEVNVMGTVNIIEAVRNTGTAKVLLNITSDKCYDNKEWMWGYRENDALGGFDPYSNSKGCAEMVTSAFRSSFFGSAVDSLATTIATARAGNVIGGGDWAKDRLLPDIFRAIEDSKKIIIRNPVSYRPWQHVIEPLFGYLQLCYKMYTEKEDFAGAWNFGPAESSTKSVEWIVKRICSLWGNGADYEIDSSTQPHEAYNLKLDCSKANNVLKWTPKWNIETSLEKIVEWNKDYFQGNDIRDVCVKQINEYILSQEN